MSEYTASHKFHNDGRVIYLGLKSEGLTKYFCGKLGSGWFRSKEFMTLVEVTDGQNNRWLTEPDALKQQELWEAVNQIPFWEQKIDTYCRGSGSTLKFLNVEIARIDSMLATKADLSVRVLALSCSAVVAYGERVALYFEEHDGAWNKAKQCVLLLLSLLALVVTASGLYNKCTYLLHLITRCFN